jgi:Ricin-type beta-trefoil lectin domain
MRRSRPLTVLLAAVVMVFATMGSAAPAQASGPAYKIQFNYSGLCLTVYNGSPMGSAAMQWNCDGYANGRWAFDFVGSYAKIRNLSNGRCLTVYNGSDYGSTVMLWNCDGYDNGLWLGRILTNAGGRDWYELINKATAECLTIHFGSYQLGAEAVLGSCAPSNPYNLVTWYV